MVRDLLGLDQGYPRLRDDHIDAYLDEAFVVMATELCLPRLSAEYDVVVTSGSSVAELDANVLRVVDVSIGGDSLDATELHRVVVESPGWRSESGVPRQFWEEPASAAGRTRIRIHPTPTSTVILKVTAIRVPPRVATYNDGDITDWPPLAQYAACYEAALRSSNRASEIVPADTKASWRETAARYVAILKGSTSLSSATGVAIDRVKENIQ